MWFSLKSPRPPIYPILGAHYRYMVLPIPTCRTQTQPDTPTPPYRARRPLVTLNPLTPPLAFWVWFLLLQFLVAPDTAPTVSLMIGINYIGSLWIKFTSIHTVQIDLM
ncbi:hypothetical protein CW304_32210 [Bacillus sp. UFRGS-B20]|nr:hypothetical protein CW304_32210 [Bacillus sp. UFRGS-B20]